MLIYSPLFPWKYYDDNYMVVINKNIIVFVVGVDGVGAGGGSNNSSNSSAK